MLALTLPTFSEKMAVTFAFLWTLFAPFAGLTSATPGAVLSSLMVRDFGSSALPALSVARYWTTVVPSVETVNGAE